MGQIFSGIAVVVVLCLLFSLVESQLVLPSHLGHLRVGHERESKGAISSRWKRVQDVMSNSLTRLAGNHYRAGLERALAWRYTTLSIAVVLLLWTVATVSTGRLKFSFFPPVESDYASATLTMAHGTPVDHTIYAVKELEAAALRVKQKLEAEYPDLEGPIVKHVMVSLGTQPSSGSHGGSRSPASSGSHLAEVSLELMSADHRPISGAAVVALWREEAPLISEAESLTFSSSLFSVGDPIDFRLQSADTDDLVLAAEELKEKLGEYPGVFDVRDSFQEGKQELELAILPSAEALGLTLEDLARQVRQAFYGEEVQRIQRDQEDVRVMVRFPEDQRRSLGDLENMRIRTPDGGEVPFYSVASVEMGRGFATIRRSDRQRVVNVSADVDLTIANANEVMASLRGSYLPQLLADHPGLQFSLRGEQEEQGKVIAGMLRTLLLALILIYTLLAVPLRSYSQPLMIMAVIPFGLVGAVGGHLLMRTGLSMMSVMGVVALSGVVVNASLVMVHYINGRREHGDSIGDAVRTAAVARFRPIVLTSLTTFAGLSPLLMERSVSAQFLIPMAISLAFGVAFSTLITLFVVPCTYMILEDLKSLLRGSRDDSSGGDVTEIGMRPARARRNGMRNAG
jgi:multidrug efflux pump subunit AcrB